MNTVSSELQAIGIDVIQIKQEGELFVFKSRSIDRLGPSRLNEKLFEAYDAGQLSVSPFKLYALTA